MERVIMIIRHLKTQLGRHRGNLVYCAVAGGVAHPVYEVPSALGSIRIGETYTMAFVAPEMLTKSVGRASCIR